MASKHKQEDPWAGFVDVLSNILMVVIFLVVILGISIFAISQQVTKVAVEKAVQEEREKAAAPKPPPPPKPEEVAEATPPPAPDAAPKAEEKPVEPQPKPEEGERGAAGDRKPDQGLRLRESDEIKGNSNLTVRSRQLADEKNIEVASEEVKPNVGPIKVESSQSFLSLKFSKGSFRLDPKTTEEVQKYLTDNKDKLKGTIEIRAFAQSTIGSISEARRIAFYRAMLIRSELVKSGVPTDSINVVVRESPSPEEADAVKVLGKSS